MGRLMIKIVRFWGWSIFLLGLVLAIIFFFLAIEKDMPTNRRTEAIIGIAIFGALSILGFKLTRFRKKQEQSAQISHKNHWEEKDESDIENERNTLSSAEGIHTETIRQENATVNNDIAEKVYNTTPKEREKREPISRKTAFIKVDYRPLLELCSEIENNTENNYIPFDPSIPVEIVYCDRDGITTTRMIDVRYIAKSDYDYSNYYFKAFCHLRNEDRSFNVERIQKTTVNENEVDFIQYIVNAYRNTETYKEIILSIKTKNLINSNDIVGYSAKILTYIARIDGIFTRKEKTVIADFIKSLATNHAEIEIENYIDELSELKPTTPEYKAIVKNADISDKLIEKAIEITGKDSLRQGAFQILFNQYQKNNPNVKF